MRAVPASSLMLRYLGLLLGLVLVTLPAFGVQSASLPDTIPVTTTIQAAIDAAEDGDTISIPGGLYVENLTVDKSLTLAAVPGPGGSMATLWPSGNSRIITVAAGHDLTLKDLVLAGGFPEGAGSNEGGAVYLENGALTLDHCMVYSNKGNYGGAIRQKGVGQVTAQNDTHIYNNTASIDGGGIMADGDVSLTDFVLEYNQAGRHGGGASVMGNQWTAVRGRLTGNTAEQNGGGVNLNNSASVEQVQFIDNSAGEHGGGMFQWNGDDGLTVGVHESTFDGNEAGLTGGALSVYNGAATTITYSLFLNNRAYSQSMADPKGGAVYFSDTTRGHTLTIHTSTFQSNSVECDICLWPSGGGLFAVTTALGEIDLSEDQFLDNDGWQGGGVTADRAVIDRTIFQGNTGGSGGGAYLTGASEITNSAFTQNSVANWGAGLDVTTSAPSLVIEDTRFSGNSGGFGWGGALKADAALICMKNVIVADTQVESGGAIVFANMSSTIELFHLTVNDTHLESGAHTGTIGIHFVGFQTATIWNSMITNHATGVQSDANNTVMLDHTLWFGNGQNIGGTGAYVDNLPVYSDPAYAVDRFHLTSASGAIDHGVDRLVLHDFDGEARDGLPDIGADEFRVNIYLPLIRR